MTGDLFSGLAATPRREQLDASAVLLHGFAASIARELIVGVNDVAQAAPFRNMVTPGGHRMSVAMTNCGKTGWVTDATGYRYDPVDPVTGRQWPDMPALFRQTAEQAAAEAGYAGFTPDACLINRYRPGAKLSLHQDRNERDFLAPIVSVSLGLPAIFLWGGTNRRDRPRRVLLENGDIVVWGGATRLHFHGVDSLADGDHSLTGRCRINLTFRRAL